MKCVRNRSSRQLAAVAEVSVQKFAGSLKYASQQPGSESQVPVKAIQNKELDLQHGTTQLFISSRAVDLCIG
jgi:hypothetical protein